MLDTRAPAVPPPSLAPRGRRRGERGIILIITLWVVLIVTALAMTLAFQTRTEVSMSRYAFDAHQAHYAAKTGMYRAMILLREDVLKDQDVLDKRADVLVELDDKDVGFQYDGSNEEWYFGGERGYEDVPVELPVRRGDDLIMGSYTVRVLDQASRINLNYRGYGPEVFEGLLYATGIEDEDLVKALAALIQDWRDPDDQPVPEGYVDDKDWGKRDSEGTFWNPGLDQREIREGTAGDYFVCKNGPFGSVEELLILLQHLETLGLMPPGMAPIYFFGEDANENGELDDNEKDGDDSYPPDDGDNVLLLGLRNYLTVDSRDRVNINTAGVVVIEALLRSMKEDREPRDRDAQRTAEDIFDYISGPDKKRGDKDDRVLRTPNGADEEGNTLEDAVDDDEVLTTLRRYTDIRSDVFTIVSTGRYPAAEKRSSFSRSRERDREDRAVRATIRCTVFRDFVERILLEKEKNVRGGSETDENEELDDPRDDDPARLYVIRYSEEGDF